MADAKKKQVSTAAPAAAAQPSGRPTGVTIVSILGILGSLLYIFSGILEAVLGSTMTTGIFAQASGMAMIMGAAFLIVGIITLVAYIMLMKMKRTGLILVYVFGIIGIVMGLLGIMTSLLTIVLNIIILAYLYTKRSLFV